MNKSTHFFGQPVFGQLISMIDTGIISRNSKKHKEADHYAKRFLVQLFYIVTHSSTQFRVFAVKKDTSYPQHMHDTARKKGIAF